MNEIKTKLENLEKERYDLIKLERSSGRLEANANILSNETIKDYWEQTYLPRLIQITNECETLGHVNLETKSYEDGGSYFVCDNCGLQVNIID